MNTYLHRFLGAIAVAVATLTTLAHANAPAGRYVITASGTAGGTVYDTKTNLTWQQKTSSASSLAAAKTYCAGAAANTLPGTGWRVPTAKELVTLIDNSRQSPAMDPTAFASGYGGGPTWSSSPVTSVGYTWQVDFGLGTTGYAANGSPGVRCVLSGRLP